MTAPPFGLAGILNQQTPAGGGGTAIDTLAGVAHVQVDISEETGYSASDPMASLVDQSGNGRTLTASGTARPLYTTSEGFPAAFFDGTNDMASVQYGANLAHPATYILLSRMTDLTANRRFMDGYSTGGNQHALTMIDGSPDRFRVFGGSALTDAGTPSTSWTIYVCRINGASSGLWVNGGTEVVTGNSGSNGSNGLRLGLDTGGSWAFNGYHNFVSVYPGDLYTADLSLLNDVGNELATRAGITWTTIT